MNWYKIAQNPKRAILVHGWYGSPQKNWFPWLKKKLESEGFKVIVPKMPKPSKPEIKPWVNKLKDVTGESDKNTYFIGHSLGCQAIMRYLQTLPDNTEIGTVLFVAGFVSKLTPVETWEDSEPDDQKIVDSWLNSPLDLDKIRNMTSNFVAIFSDDDPYVPIKENSRLFEKELGAEIIVEKNKGHFDDTEQPVIFEKLLEIN